MTNLSVSGVVALLLFVFCLPVFALDDFGEIDVYKLSGSSELNYSGYISLGFGWDSEDSNDYFVDLEVDLPSQIQFLFSANLYKSDVDFNADESKNYVVGLFNDPDEFWILGLEYDYYKEQNLYTIDAFRLTAGVNLGGWALKLIPQRRLINGEFRILNRMLTLAGTSTGYGGEVEYIGHDSWNLQLAYHKYQYEGNELFDRLLDLKPSQDNILLDRKRSILAGIEDNRWTFSTNYLFEWGSVGFDWVRSVGIGVSADIAFIYMLSVSTFVTESLAIDLDVGSLTVSNDNDYLIFSTLSLTYFW